MCIFKLTIVALRMLFSSRHVSTYVLIALVFGGIVNVRAYNEEAVEVQPSGFHMSAVEHEVDTNQIVVNLTVSAGERSVPLLFISKVGANEATLELSNHPCEGSANDDNICCLNHVITDYQVAPDMQSLLNDPAVCPGGTKNMSKNSLYVDALSSRLPPGSLTNSDFLASGVEWVMQDVTTRETVTLENGTVTEQDVVTQQNVSRPVYPEGLSYRVLGQDGDSYTIEVRLTHNYLKTRARVTDMSSGLFKYEFTMGATFVELMSHTSAVSITSAQALLTYYKSEFVFLSISSEQSRTPLDTLGVEIHQATSAANGGLYQWILLDADYDRNRYPGAARIIPDTLRWARVPTLTDATGAAWQYPCRSGDGYYYTDTAGATDLASVGAQTCVPDTPTFCRFDVNEDFFLPFPTAAAQTGGYISGPDQATNIYLGGILELTDSQGYKHLSTFFVSIDLDGYPVLVHCTDVEFKYHDVTDALKITARVGVKAAADNAVALQQTVSEYGNRNLNELIETPTATSRRLLSMPSEEAGGDVAGAEEVDGKVNDEAENETNAEFEDDDSSEHEGREGRRLLQVESEGACEEPICGFQQGADVDLPCKTDVMASGREYKTYQCVPCSKVTFDPLGYNHTYLTCQFGTCTMQQADGTWKFISRDNSWQRAPAFKDYGRGGFYATGVTDHNSDDSSKWRLPFQGINSGTPGRMEITYDADVDWGAFPTPKMTKPLGYFKQIAVMPDNTIRRWGRVMDSPSRMNYNFVGRSPTRDGLGTESYSIQAFFESPEAVVPFPHNATETIVQLATTADRGKFMILTKKSRAYLCDPLADCSLQTPIDFGTKKRITSISGTNNGFFIVFIDGSVKALGGASYNGFAPTNGYAELADDTISANGFDVSNVKDAPFLGIKARRIKHQGYATETTGSYESGKAFLANAHVCAITQDNDLLCWGDNEFGQLGTQDTFPRGAGWLAKSITRHPSTGIKAPTCTTSSGTLGQCWLDKATQSDVTTRTLAVTGSVYGDGNADGDYVISWSTNPITCDTSGTVCLKDGKWWTPDHVFRTDAYWQGLNQNAVFWNKGEYAAGDYVGSNYLVPDYLGDFITIRYPVDNFVASRVFFEAGNPLYLTSTRDRMPGHFRVYGRNDGGDWEMLYDHTERNYEWTVVNSPFSVKYFDIGNKKAFKEYGIVVNKLQGTTYSALAMYRLQFHGYPLLEGDELSVIPLAELAPVDLGLTANGDPVKVTDYAVGFGFTCVLTHEYKVKCWGRNNVGQLGQFDTVQRGDTDAQLIKDIPYLDFGDEAVIRLEATDNNAIAIFDNGEFQSWGLCANKFPFSEPTPTNDIGCGGNPNVIAGSEWGCINVGDGKAAQYSKGLGYSSCYKSYSVKPLSFVPFTGGLIRNADQRGGKRKHPPAARCGAVRITSVKTQVEIPITVDAFTETLQQEYVTTLAAIAGVSDDQVVIVSITAVEGGGVRRRRLLQTGSGISVETEINDDSGALDFAEETLTTESINTYLEENPVSTLPPLTVGTIATEEEVVESAEVVFEGASSYAEAALAVELDAITFMQRSYAQDLTIRVDSMLIMNFLGLGHFDTILAMIRNGDGFNMTKQGTDKFYTLAPEFNGALVCDQVTSTVMISPSQFSCFWRRAISNNAVSPEAAESLYYYKQGGDADISAAKVWIRDTMLGGETATATLTAEQYFNRSCSRSVDSLAEPRSYGCLYVDPGYRWISRTRGQVTLSPLEIADKTLVIAILTIAHSDGTVFRRRLLAAEGGLNGRVTHVDLEESAPGVLRRAAINRVEVNRAQRRLAAKKGIAPPSLRVQPGVSHHSLLAERGAALRRRPLMGQRQLLQTDSEEDDVLNSWSNTAMLQTNNVDPVSNYVKLTGNEHESWQILRISTARGQSVPLEVFKFNTATVLRAAARMTGSAVRKMQTLSFEPVPNSGGIARRLLSTDGIEDLDMTIIASFIPENYGVLYVDTIKCLLGKIAEQVTFADTTSTQTLIESCSGTELETWKALYSSKWDNLIRISKSACGSSTAWSNENQTECVVEVHELFTKTTTEPDERALRKTTAKVKISLNFDTPKSTLEDPSMKKVLRLLIAEALKIQDASKILIYVKDRVASSTARRLLSTGSTLEVYIYDTPRTTDTNGDLIDSTNLETDLSEGGSLYDAVVAASTQLAGITFAGADAPVLEPVLAPLPDAETKQQPIQWWVWLIIGVVAVILLLVFMQSCSSKSGDYKRFETPGPSLNLRKQYRTLATFDAMLGPREQT
jgi:hypothetical protein